MLQQIIKNQYVVLQKLGGGGFGDTYLTEDTHKPSRPHCVVKELRPITNNPHMYNLVQGMFQREAVMLENLGNSNNRIPKLYAYFFDQGKFYLVQEYIQGKTLTQMLEASGTVSETVVKEILKNLLYVLNFVHSRQIIHRDIKPDNIILRESDNIPVLIDFGAVRESVGTEFNSQGQPITSKVIGTPGFMPAEQAAGRPVYSSDLYSLGLTMIYLLTGKTPLQLQTDSRTGNIIWHQYAMHVSPNLRKVLDKAIAYNLNERYMSAKEMIDAMQVTPLPTSASPTYINPPQSGLVGGGGTFNTSVSVPQEIQGWNWGAFLLPGLWVFSNQVWIGLLCMIPLIGLPIPFLLGASGNVWAWKSRQWKSVEDFKAHQRAWSIAGGSVWGSLIGLFILALMVAPSKDSTTPTENTSITTTPTSEPLTTTPSPLVPPVTTPKTREIIIGNLQAYTHQNSLFSIDIPEGWTLADKSQPGETIVYWQDRTGNALAQINVFAANGNRSKQEMIGILEGFLNKTVTANTNFSKSKPVFLADGTIRITWNNEVLVKGEKIRMTGNSYVEQHGDKLALYTIVVPSEQYSKLLPSIQQINASYKINASAPLPR
jgi:hypothetical protein